MITSHLLWPLYSNLSSIHYISGPRKVPHALAAAGPSQILVQAAEAAPCWPDCQSQPGSPNVHSCFLVFVLLNFSVFGAILAC